MLGTRRDYLGYLVVRLAIALIQMLSDRVVVAVADALGRLAYRLDHRHRRIADENLRHAFPDLNAFDRDRLVRQSFVHFVGVLFEIARLPRKMHVDNWRKFADLVRGDLVIGAMTSGRPAMIVTAHFGNWELAGYALGLLGFHTHAIARPLDNPYLDHLLRRFRERTGQRVIAKKGEYDQITNLLRSGGVLATLADQDAGQRGMFVEFFGRPASTHKAIALMAIEYGVQLVVVGVPRVALPMKYHIEVEEVIDPAEYEGNPRAAMLITQRYTNAIERLIRRHPGQYFWQHRRWKHQPLSRKAKAA